MESSEPKLRHHDKLIRAIGDMRRDGFTVSHNAVLRHLADRHNDARGCAWPAISDIAHCTWLSEATVSRAIADLKKAGLLEVRYRTKQLPGGTVVNTSSEYCVLIPAAADHINGGEGGFTLNPGWVHSEGRVGSEQTQGGFMMSPGWVQSDVKTVTEPPAKLQKTITEQPAGFPVSVVSFETEGKDKDKDNSNSNDNSQDSFHRGTSFPVQLGPSAPTPRDAATPSAEEDVLTYSDLDELEDTFGELLPGATCDRRDLEVLLRTERVENVEQVLRWAVKISDWKWKSVLRSSKLLLKHFAQMQQSRSRFYAGEESSKRSSFRGKPPSPAQHQTGSTCPRCKGRGAVFSELVNGDLPCVCVHP